MITIWFVKLILMILIATGSVANWHTYDGHRNCYALLGDTTIVLCADGYVTTT